MKLEVVGVITGDVVNSRSYSEKDFDGVLNALKTTLVNLEKKKLGSFDIFRGDSFQFITSNLKEVMTIALIIRLSMKVHEPSVNVRQSIGIGSLGSRRDSVRVSTGDAFVLSGHGLEEMKNGLFAFSTKNAQFEQNMRLLTKFFDIHLSKLTRFQSQALLAYIETPSATHEELAAKLGKTRLAITKLLNASDYSLVGDYLKYYKDQLPESKDLI